MEKADFIRLFGVDHYSTLLYVESCCVDRSGQLEREKMRCNPARHPQFKHRGGWSDAHSTRWALHHPMVKGHDDWDCVDDLEKAGLVISHGTGVHPIYELTDEGWKLAHQQRRDRAQRLLKEALT